MLLVFLLAAFSSSILGSLSSSLSSPSMSDGPQMVDPSASDLMAETCSACSCMSVENVLYVNCEKITVYRPTQLIPPASSLYHLNFQNNFLIILYPNSFLNFTHAVSLQLGNNKLQNIEGGAFMGMSALKQLHLNNNELKVLRADTFLGIENLEYLQADYNLIKYIEKGAFNKLHKLKVLILNDNLIQALPDNIFRFASLTHLDIRGNRIQKLPYLGVLEHIGRIVELQLDDNPWNCTCDLAPLKAWLENMPYNIFIGEAICETPSDLYGRLLKETNKQELCPMGTGSDFDVRMPPVLPDNGQSPSKTSPTTVAPLATKAPKTTDSSKIYGNGIVAGLPPFGRNSQIVSFQTRTPPLLCPQPCSCKAHPSDFGISVSCQERNIKNLADLIPKPPNAKKLHLSGNYIRDISPTDFQGFEGLDLLHLGSNQIVTVQKGVFSNLTNLRRLYLNGNQLEQLHPEMFLGLTNLQYLYLEYNAIKEILAGTFDSMPNLQLLYLNNNVLRSLPAYVFAGVSLARLNLKNNHFMTLPVSGVLDQLRSLTQIDLEGNPWECSCDLVALKLWLEKLSDGVAAKEVKCASPVQFSNIELRHLKNEILCPKLVARPPFVQTSPTPVLTSVSPAGVGKAPPGGPVPLSIMILSILVVLILTVFVAFCLLVFVLRRNKKPVGRQEGLGNQECGSMSLQLRRHGHKSGKKSSIPGDDLGGETFIPQTIEHIGKSHTCGIGRSSDMDAGFKFADSQRQKIILRNSADKDKDSLSTLERNKRLSTIDELEEFLPHREPSMFIQNFLDSKRDFNSIGMGGYEIRYPEKTLDKKMKKSSLIGGNHSKIVVEQRKSELYFLSTGVPSATSPSGVVYKVVDPSRRAPPRHCHYDPLPVRVKSNLIKFVPQETLIGEEPPSRHRTEAPSTESYDWLQELIDRLGELGQDQTTALPTTSTPKPPRHPRRKGRRRKGKSRTESRPEIREGAVRLVGDEEGRGDRGRVEVFVGGEWGTVCDDLWTTNNAAVVCQQLGFRFALKAAKNSEFGEGRGLRILLDDVQCDGNESTLLDCKHAGVGTHNCAHYEDAGVICGNSDYVVHV